MFFDLKYFNNLYFGVSLTLKVLFTVVYVVTGANTYSFILPYFEKYFFVILVLQDYQFCPQFTSDYSL